MTVKRLAVLLGLCAALAAPAGAASGKRMIPVPRVTLYPGDPLSPDILVLKSFVFPSGAEARYASDPAQLSGKFAKRTLIAGKPVALAHVHNGQVVKQGRPVVAVYTDLGLTISGELIPLESGEVGQRIAARNPSSGSTVTAVVQADGTLAVDSQ